MNKIPVFKTIAHAYRFAFGQFLRLLGVTWAPLLVVTAFGLMLTPGFMGNHMPVNDPDEIARQTLRLFPLTFAVMLIARGMVATGVTELALGVRSGLTVVFFSVGLSVWRFVGSWLLVMLLMLVLIVGSALALGLLLAAGGMIFGNLLHVSAAGTAIVVVGVVLIFYAFIFFVGVRLTFLIPPVVVVERKIDLARGWILTRGNFWRIFVIGLAIFIPLIAAGCAIFLAVYGTEFLRTIADVFMLSVHSAKQAVIEQRLDALSANMRAQSLAVWPYTAAANLIVQTIAYGLLYGASAFAYRSVTPEPAVQA
ncbi:MAG TPA: hypothetical protein VG867_08600 [Rhizomicrobium sp.]|nr:hypothetical protein [Rhizomicrobium sp.]